MWYNNMHREDQVLMVTKGTDYNRSYTNKLNDQGYAESGSASKANAWDSVTSGRKTKLSESIFPSSEAVKSNTDENLLKNSTEKDYSKSDESKRNQELIKVGSAVGSVSFIIRSLIVLPIALYIYLIMFPVLIVLKLFRQHKIEDDFDNFCDVVLESVECFKN